MERNTCSHNDLSFKRIWQELSTETISKMHSSSVKHTSLEEMTESGEAVGNSQHRTEPVWAFNLKTGFIVPRGGEHTPHENSTKPSSIR